MDRKIKQRIIIPDDIRKIGNILALNCVVAFNKVVVDKPFYLAVDKVPGDECSPVWFAYPGDALIELETGEWIVEKKQ